MEKRLGFDVTVKSLALWNKKKIKQTIQDKYNTDPTLTYVLIFGDANLMPTEEMHQNLSLGKLFATDFYYRCMDGEDDLLPDVFLGRIPVSNLYEANTVVDKIIYYEKKGLNDPFSYVQLVMAGYLQDKEEPIGVADRRFIRTCEEISTNLSEINYISRNYVRDRDSTYYWSPKYYKEESIPTSLIKSNIWNTTPRKLAENINEGCWAVLYRGHGEIDGWHSIGLNTTHLNLLNSNDTPIYFSITCNTGAFHHDSQSGELVHSFAENLLKLENNGASGIISASKPSWSGFNDSFTLGIFDALWPSENWPPYMNQKKAPYLPALRPLQRIGDIMDYGLTRMEQWTIFNRYDKFGFDYIVDTWKIFHIFGDPSMRVYTQVPRQAYKSNIERFNNCIKINVEDDELIVQVFNENTGQCDRFPSPCNIVYNTEDEQNISVSLINDDCLPLIDLGSNCINNN